MNDENKKEGLSIPVFTKPVAKDGSEVAGVSEPQVNVTPEQGFTPPSANPVQNVEVQSVVTNPVVQGSNIYSENHLNPGVSGQLSLQQIAEGQVEPPMEGVNPYAHLTNDAVNSVEFEDDSHIRAFIGPNYEKIKSGKFNWGCFFFGLLYLFHRKMIGIGTVIGVVSNVIGAVIGYYTGIGNISSVLIIVSTILFAFTANRYYYNDSLKRVKKIELANMGKNDAEIVMICTKKGGKGIISIILGLLVFAFFSISVELSLTALGVPWFGSDNGPKVVDYSADLKYEQGLKIEDYVYETPSEYKVVDLADYFHFEKAYSSSGKCVLDIGKITNYTSSEKYIEAIVDQTKNSEYRVKVSGTTKGKNEWIVYTDALGKHYAGNVRDSVFVGKSSTSGLFGKELKECNNDLEFIIKSFDIKE